MSYFVSSNTKTVNGEKTMSIEKRLTISVAAFNVSTYLQETLESCVIPEIMDALEVIVVNDGSTDETEKIAQQFVDLYPETFRLINKENGGYGTTVCRSMRDAKGTYFKLLDGDDWLDRDGLIKLVQLLKNTEADWVLTRVLRVKDGTYETSEDNPGWMNLCGRTCTVKELSNLNFSRDIGMWSLTSKTELLRQHSFELPEHKLYTDQLFVFYQMPFVRTISFCDFSVYKYRIGRDGQSISRQSRIKNYRDAIDNTLTMLDYYKQYRESQKDNVSFMMQRLASYYNFAVKTYLLLPSSKQTKNDIMVLENRCKTTTEDVYNEAYHRRSKILIILRLTHYLAYYPLAKIGISNWG
jgi:Glycosyltransferases involved in cell wall biogenesis